MLSTPDGSFGTSPLLTDLYQLTMAQGYMQEGLESTQASFYLFFIDNPFKGGFTVAAGTSLIGQLVESMHFSDSDLEYLAGLKAPGGGPLFTPEFLNYLKNFEPDLTIDAVPEGTIVFPRAPMVRVTGSIMAAQLLETALLNLINFQTLIATKAARVVLVAEGTSVAEFGLRRAQGPDGGISASRAAYVGGCNSTSNVLAGKIYDIPVSGTHSHSWVMAFDSELEAFRAYAKSQPKNCILLVDTYDVENGVKNAITVAKEMEAAGEKLMAIRIDSGDLAELSKMARNMFDEAGLEYVKISVSNDLDEYLVKSLLDQGAPIGSWGVGTKLATSYEQPALGGVYKLSAVKRQGSDQWIPTLKVSESHQKMTIPGILGLRRYSDEKGRPIADMIVDPQYEHDNRARIIDPLDDSLSLDLTGFESSDLLVRVVEKGRALETESIHEARKRTLESLSKLPNPMKRFLNPQIYPCGLEEGLHELRDSLIANQEEVRVRSLWSHDVRES